MQNDILFDWKFWIIYYFFLSYSLCLIDLFEASLRISIKALLKNIIDGGFNSLNNNVDERSIFIETSPLDFIMQFICITVFAGAVQAMLISKGIQLFTFQNIFCTLIAALFSMEFHKKLTKAIFNKVSSAYEVFIPALISISFGLCYLFAFKSSELFSFYKYPGELIYGSFLVPWLPILILATATMLRYTGAIFICLEILLLWLILFIQIISLPFNMICVIFVSIKHKLTKKQAELAK